MGEVDKDTIGVELCAPERDPLRFEATEVIIPGSEGIFTVLPEHSPFLSTLGTGVLVVYTTSGEEKYFAINGGFAEVNQNRVIVLTQTAESEKEVDTERAEDARKRAEERLRKRADDTDLDRAEAALERAMARLYARQHRGF